MSANQPPKESWHFDKKVPIALILTLVTGYAGGIWFIAGLRKDVDQIKEASRVAEAVQHERDQRQDDAVREAVTRIEGGLKDLSGQINRLIERGSK